VLWTHPRLRSSGPKSVRSGCGPPLLRTHSTKIGKEVEQLVGAHSKLCVHAHIVKNECCIFVIGGREYICDWEVVGGEKAVAKTGVLCICGWGEGGSGGCRREIGSCKDRSAV
jgi:hypothetical protein